MKALIAASIAAAAFLASTAAFPQSSQPAGDTQVPDAKTGSTAGAAEHHHWYSAVLRNGGRDSRSNNECVGPASYCDLYFGS